MPQIHGNSDDRTNRVVYLDILRIICILFVIFNHTRTEGVELYTLCAVNTFDYWGSIFIAILCKVAVPVFFMISGVTLLSKTENLKTFYVKRVLRFALVIVVFTFLQYLRIYRVHPEDGFSLKTWLINVYAGNIIEPYWFLKSYFSFLLIVPILRILVKNMEQKHFLYLIALKGVELLLFIIMIISGYLANLSFPLNTDIIFYPLFGYYLGNVIRPGEKKRIGSWMYALICILSVALIAVWDTLMYVRTGSHQPGVHQAFTWILAGLFFMSFRFVEVKKVQVRRVIASVGGAVFGTYLIEDVVRNQFEFLYPLLVPYTGGILCAVIFTLVSALTGLAVIYLLRLIPFVRKLI